MCLYVGRPLSSYLSRYMVACFFISLATDLQKQKHHCQFENKADALPCHFHLYASETWTLSAALQKRIQAMKMRCFRKILRISYKDHVINEAVRNEIKQAIGPYDDLLTTVKKRKLKWYGHVSRSSGLAKTILQGTVRGGRRRGRQKKRWEDNIKEWTGMEFADSQRAVENRETRRELVRKSSMVPQRSLRVMGK